MSRRLRRLLCAGLLAALVPGGGGVAGAAPAAELLELGMPLAARIRFLSLPPAEQGGFPLLPALLRRLSDAGYPEEAISLFEEVRPLLKGTIRPTALLAAGEILWDRGDRASACRIFREAAAPPDPSPEASLRAGRCLAIEGRIPEAAAHLSRAGDRGRLLAGYVEMDRGDRKSARAAWMQAGGTTPAGRAARISALSAGESRGEYARALDRISRDPAAAPPERDAALAALASMHLRGGKPAEALAAVERGLREATTWKAAASRAGAWDRTAPGGRIAWEALSALFPYGEDAGAFRRAGRRFLARAALAGGTLTMRNRLRETSRRLRGAEEAVARTGEPVEQALRRVGDIEGTYRAAAERAGAVRARLRQAADRLVLSGWGAGIDPETFSSLEVADHRIRFLRDRLAEVASLYSAKLREEGSLPLSPADRRMVLAAQTRLDRLERRIRTIESRRAFLRRAVWNRWKAEFVSRASALMDRAEAVPSRAAEGADRSGRIAVRLRGTLDARAAWIAQIRRMRWRLERREAVLARWWADLQEEAGHALDAAGRELSAAISRRERSLHYLAARAATEPLVAGPAGKIPPAEGMPLRDDLREKALRHWEAVLSSPEEPGGFEDEALYASAELKYEEEERRFFAETEREERRPDHSESLARFRRVVQDHPRSPYREQAWYGMALCLQEMGDPDGSARAMKALLAAYPDSRFANELHLRLGEDAFDRYDFDEAATEYGRVGPEASPDLRATARFKLGWSLFLRGNPAEAAGAFLESLLFSRAARKTGGVAEESMRMMSRSLVDAGMEGAAEEFLAHRGAAGHGPATLLAIQSVLDTQNRYVEEAGIADRIARVYPTAPERIEAELSAAEALRKGNRVEDGYRRKAGFVRAFGPGSRWQFAPERTAADIARANLVAEEGLRTALLFFHGQSRRSPPGDRPFLRAGYDAYLSLFPSPDRAGEVAFQRGWLLFEDGRTRESAAAFEAAADRYGGDREEAARYMAIQAMKDATGPSDPGARSEVVRLARRYERSFPEGNRLPLVLLDRARAHFHRREFAEAAEAARRAADRLPEGADRLAARRLAGDARFEHGDFEEAEREFRAVLAATADPRTTEDMRKWIGFSMFRRAEGLAGEAAATLFGRVAGEFPGIEIAPTARFRSGSAFAEAGKNREAIAAFLSVESHPGNLSLSVDATRRLALLYERTGDPVSAADRYERLGEAEPDGEEKRNLLLRASDLLSGADEPRRRRLLQAVASLPGTSPDLRISCLFRAAESARRETREEEADRLYGNILAIQADAPGVSTGLAGKAAWFRGEYRFARYRAIAIVPPLDRTFRAKQAALERAADPYLVAIRLGDGETVSASLHRLGEIFEEFRNALLSSAFPKGLTAEEREEYRFLLEEKAAPIEEKAVEAYRKNLRQAVAADIDSPWALKSLERLRALRPALFAKRWEYAFPVVTIPVFRGIVERRTR